MDYLMVRVDVEELTYFIESGVSLSSVDKLGNYPIHRLLLGLYVRKVALHEPIIDPNIF